MKKKIRYKILTNICLLGGVWAFLAVITASGIARAQDAPPASAWTVRCQEQDVNHCEIFQRLVVQETGLRLAEFAIGFPQGKKAARGVMILPLGILLPEGVQMQIDDQQAFKFKVRFCTQDGCFAYLNLNDAVLNMMRKGNEAVVSFRSLQGQEMKFPVSLKGFTKALADIS